MKLHYIHKLIATGEVRIRHIGSNLNKADFLTKASPRATLTRVLAKLGIQDSALGLSAKSMGACQNARGKRAKTAMGMPLVADSDPGETIIEQRLRRRSAKHTDAVTATIPEQLA